MCHAPCECPCLHHARHSLKRYAVARFQELVARSVMVRWRKSSRVSHLFTACHKSATSHPRAQHAVLLLGSGPNPTRMAIKRLIPNVGALDAHDKHRLQLVADWCALGFRLHHSFLQLFATMRVSIRTPSGHSCSQRLVARANRAEKLVALVGANVAFAAQASAEYRPSVEALSSMSYDAVTKANEAVTPVVVKAAEVDASAAVDTAPLLGGLAFGIAIAGSAIAYFTGEKGPTTKVPILSFSYYASDAPLCCVVAVERIPALRELAPYSAAIGTGSPAVAATHPALRASLVSTCEKW